MSQKAEIGPSPVLPNALRCAADQVERLVAREVELEARVAELEGELQAARNVAAGLRAELDVEHSCHTRAHDRAKTARRRLASVIRAARRVKSSENPERELEHGGDTAEAWSRGIQEGAEEVLLAARASRKSA